MSQLIEYFDYLYYNLGGPYLKTQRSNQFYLSIQDSIIEVYYTKPIKTKDQTFETFQKFI